MIIVFVLKYGWKIVFLGVILGLVIVNLIGVFIGDKIGDVLLIEVIYKGVGVLFIVFGILMLFGKM